MYVYVFIQLAFKIKDDNTKIPRNSLIQTKIITAHVPTYTYAHKQTHKKTNTYTLFIHRNNLIRYTKTTDKQMTMKKT